VIEETANIVFGFAQWLETGQFNAEAQRRGDKRGEDGRGRLRQVFFADREAADALAGGLEDCVADGGGDAWRAGLTGAAGGVLAVDDVYFHERHFIDTQHIVLVEVALLYAAAVDGYAAFERRGQAEGNATLDLLLEELRG